MIFLISNFEVLIKKPRYILQKVCKFFEVRFSEILLNPPVHHSSFKSEKKSGFNKPALVRWKNMLPKYMRVLTEKCCYSKMVQFGYLRNKKFHYFRILETIFQNLVKISFSLFLIRLFYL